MDIDLKEMIKAMQPQIAEFEALNNLIKAYNNLPAIVDDDYPEMRHYYESNLKAFLNACKINGR